MDGLAGDRKSGQAVFREIQQARETNGISVACPLLTVDMLTLGTQAKCARTPCHTTPHRTTPHHTAPHHVTPHDTTPHRTKPNQTTPHHAKLHHTTSQRTTQLTTHTLVSDRGRQAGRVLGVGGHEGYRLVESLGIGHPTAAGHGCVMCHMRALSSSHCPP